MIVCYFPNGVGVNKMPVICKKEGVTVTPILYLMRSKCSRKNDFDLLVRNIVENLNETIE